MTRDDIIRMAREVADPETEDPVSNGYATLTLDELERFATLVAAAEREACAKVCADYTAWGREWGQDNNHMAAEAATNECAAAIRARGKK